MLQRRVSEWAKARAGRRTSVDVTPSTWAASSAGVISVSSTQSVVPTRRDRGPALHRRLAAVAHAK